MLAQVSWKSIQNWLPEEEQVCSQKTVGSSADSLMSRSRWSKIATKSWKKLSKRKLTRRRRRVTKSCNGNIPATELALVEDGMVGGRWEGKERAESRSAW
jgi:hypothetical protein